MKTGNVFNSPTGSVGLSATVGYNNSMQYAAFKLSYISKAIFSADANVNLIDTSCPHTVHEESVCV